MLHESVLKDTLAFMENISYLLVTYFCISASSIIINHIARSIEVYALEEVYDRKETLWYLHILAQDYLKLV